MFYLLYLYINILFMHIIACILKWKILHLIKHFAKFLQQPVQFHFEFSESC